MPFAHRNPANKPFRLLVFDWDGTVMDSLGSIVECTQRCVEELNLTRHPDHRLRSVIGLGLRETFEELFPEIDDEMRGQVIECYRRHWFASFRDKSVLIPGAGESIQRLAGRDIFLAVATGKGRSGLERDLDATGLRPYFLATRTATEAPSKPNPQMLIEVLDELGVRPDETLMVGDTTYDLMMAESAGCSSLGVLTGSHDRDTLMGCGALECLDSVVNLPDWLGA